MANRFMDSFDHYATADILKKYNATTGDVKIVSGGRTNNALYCKSDGGYPAYNTITLDEQSVWYVGFALKTNNTSNNGTIIAFATGTSNLFQVGVMLTSSNTLVFCDDSKNQIGTVNGGTLANGVWYYIEVQMKFSSAISAGDCIVKVNNVQVMSLDAGTKTNIKGGGTTASSVYIGTYTANLGTISLDAYFDDFYVNDSNGTHNTGFLGDITVDALFTNATGTYQDFTIVGTTTSVLATTDRAPDGDSTYVMSSNTGSRESFTYTLTNYSINTVYSVQLLDCAEKSASGTRSLYPFTRSGITNYEQSPISLSTGYLYTRTVIEINPATGVTWTETDINNLEAGVRIG